MRKMQTNPINLLDAVNVDSVRCECLVIGSGVGGSVAGARLAEAGRDVLVVEEGELSTVPRYSNKIGQMTALLYRGGGITPFLGRPMIGFAEACCAGGGSVINGGLLWRTPPHILQEWKEEFGLAGFDEVALRAHFETVERRLCVNRHCTEEGNRDSQLLKKAANQFNWKVVAVPRALVNCTNLNLCATGCPSGAKQTMLETYLADACKKGARLLPNCRVYKLESKGSSRVGRARCSLQLPHGQKKYVDIEADEFFLSGGAVQTPHLLAKSGLAPHVGQRLQYHLNLKFAAKFATPVHAEQGTMFTQQVQEFEREGLYMMASNCQPNYLAATLVTHHRKEIEKLLNERFYWALYVAQLRSKSVAKIISAWNEPIVLNHFHSSDFENFKKACIRMSQLLFGAGAIQIYLPIAGAHPVSSEKEVTQALQSAQPSQCRLISVHAMASCPMGNHSTAITNTDGGLKGFDNIVLCDASILPTNIGESPQGTIMALAHEILDRRVSLNFRAHKVAVTRGVAAPKPRMNME
ncbi:MAG: GMC family oxidoreductase [Deltaproteobacteria bacterium]|nr:GMC family oxidoreductase [Deltaproteobacteria bacterium]